MGAVRIGDGLRFLAVAAPPYLAEREPLVTPEDLRNHRNLSGSFSKADLNLRARYQWLEMPTELDDPRPILRRSSRMPSSPWRNLIALT
jgi:DNA-binding transcriptional LysR family regulator